MTTWFVWPRPGPRTAGHLLLGALLASLLLLAAARPSAFSSLMQEDAWAEWATVFAYAAAGGLALVGALQRSRDRWARLTLLGLAAFTLFVAGEEISWGQRLFSFRPPKVFLEHNFQQESNLHNFLKRILDTRWIIFGIALLYGVVAPLAARWRWAKIPRALAPDPRLAPWFLAVAVLELTYPFELSGELAELLLGLVFLADVISRRAEDGARERALRTTLVLQGAVLALAVVAAPAVDALTLHNAQERTPQALQDLASLRARLGDPGVIGKRLFKKRSVHKRVYTARRARYLRLAEGEYYLDAWNQPYWVAFRRTGPGQGTLLVYSFGPNRRRDTEIDRLAGAARVEDVIAGDDLGVLLEVRRAATASVAAAATSSR
ncbi:MAG: hypothetical protein IT384_25040 [Deltaproteobacteria bacterium]|nr:hypothetical protein [Deltaproteobacteria bacterium]